VKRKSLGSWCEACERLKKSYSSAVNVYGEAVQRLARTHGPEAKTVRQELLRAIEDCERTKVALLAHQAHCEKED
jgi:hypothetical protein